MGFLNNAGYVVQPRDCRSGALSEGSLSEMTAWDQFYRGIIGRKLRQWGSFFDDDTNCEEDKSYTIRWC